MTELAYLDAIDLQSAYRNRSISPTELISSVIIRSQRLNPKINAISQSFYEQALTQAKKLEQAFMRNESLPSLAGIPIITKEKHFIKNEPISNGIQLKDEPLAVSSYVGTQRLFNNAAIIISRATTPEFSCATFTQSKIWGITRNPFNLEYSPGGSSGGSAAALAAGMATLATASDIGGSTRLPASFTATVGYKPPYGKIPGAGALAVDHYRSDGPLARSIADTALLTNVMAGLDYSDHSTTPNTTLLPTHYSGDLSNRKIALCMSLGDYQVSDDIKRNTYHMVKALETAGATVEEIILPWSSEEIMRIASIHYAHILIPALSKEIEKAEDTSDYIHSFISLTREIAGNYSYLEGLIAEYELQQQLMATLQNFDALICPASAISGLKAGEQYLNGITMPNGVHLKHYWEAHMAVPFNITNRLPVLSVPSGMADCGIPTGLQIVGKPWDEVTVFEVGAAIEKISPWRHLWQKIDDTLLS